MVPTVRYNRYIMKSVKLPTLRFHDEMSLVALCQVRSCVYILALVLTRLSFSFLSSHTTVFTITFLYHSSLSISFLLLFSIFLFFIMSHNASDTIVDPAVLVSRGKEASQVANANASSDTRVTDVDIDLGVASWSVSECKACCADTLDGRRFGAIFSDGANSFIFNRQNIHHDTDVGAWNRGWMRLRRWCPSTLTDGFDYDMSIFRHVEVVGSFYRLLHLLQNGDVMSEYCGFDICCFEDPINDVLLMKDADGSQLELEFEGRQ